MFKDFGGQLFRHGPILMSEADPDLNIPNLRPSTRSNYMHIVPMSLSGLCDCNMVPIKEYSLLRILVSVPSCSRLAMNPGLAPVREKVALVINSRTVHTLVAFLGQRSPYLVLNCPSAYIFKVLAFVLRVEIWECRRALLIEPDLTQNPGVGVAHQSLTDRV